MDPSLLVYPLVGAVAGTLAGLLGVGGGLIIVPALVATFHAADFPSTSLVHQAVGTSLATIVFTAVSSVSAHHRRGAVRWEMAARLAPGVIGGVLLGAALADVLDSGGLRRVFGLFELLIGGYLLAGQRAVGRVDPPGMVGTTAVAGIIGVVSGVAGIAGGTLTVPLLVHWRVRMHEAVATSAALGVPIALGGALGFVLTGADAVVAPWSLGYVYLPALIGIAPTSVLFAPLGARLAHRLHTLALRRVFAAFLLIVGVRMLLGP
jgi:hypothetical protein